MTSENKIDLTPPSKKQLAMALNFAIKTNKAYIFIAKFNDDTSAVMEIYPDGKIEFVTL